MFVIRLCGYVLQWCVIESWSRIYRYFFNRLPYKSGKHRQPWKYVLFVLRRCGCSVYSNPYCNIICQSNIQKQVITVLMVLNNISDEILYSIECYIRVSQITFPLVNPKLYKIYINYWMGNFSIFYVYSYKNKLNQQILLPIIIFFGRTQVFMNFL